MNIGDEIKKLEHEINEREKDRYYSDSWEQSEQITLDIKRKSSRLDELKKKAIS